MCHDQIARSYMNICQQAFGKACLVDSIAKETHVAFVMYVSCVYSIRGMLQHFLPLPCTI